MRILEKYFLAAAIASVAGAGFAQDFRADPTYGTINLRTGFTPDPTVVSLQAGGTIDAQTTSSNCLGFIANAPDVRLNYTAGSSLPLIISVAATADTTLVINGPEGSWYCDDDGGSAGFNPMVRFNSPVTGQYDIWVGTYSHGSLQPARLHISELRSQ